MKIKTPLFDIKIDILFLIVMFIFLLYSKVRIFFSSFFICYLFIVFHEASHMLVASIFGKSIESFNISLFGVSITFKKEHYSISNKITDKFDLTPRGIINYLDLRKPIYTKTTNYGHFGKENLNWERIIEL